MITHPMPTPAAPRPFTVPQPVEMRLDNGMRLVVQSKRGLPIIGAQVLFPGGASLDGASNAGLSMMTSALLPYAPASMTHEQFTTELDAIGARFGGGSNYDSIGFGISGLTDVFEQALAYGADAIKNPAFAAEDFERVRERALGDLRLNYSSASSVARMVAARVLYGEIAYGDPISGTPQSLERLPRERLLALHAHRIRPESATLVLCGDVELDRARKLAESAFGDWTVAPTSDPLVTPPIDPQALKRGRVVLVHLHDSPRAAVYVGRVAVARRDPSYTEGIMATGVLAGYSGRLNYEVRVKRGLSYGAGVGLSGRCDLGPFLASTLVENARALETVDVILDVFKSIVDRIPDEAELAPRRAMLRGAYGRTFETVGGLAALVSDYVNFGLPFSELSGYVDRIDAVTPEQLSEFARVNLVADPSIVVVGDADAIGPEFLARFGNAEVVQATELDLARSDLRRID